jgi:putative photosynthetic complex assembly protein 2
VWAWQEATLLTGWITGPRKSGSLAPAGSGRHFRHAVAAVLHHELLLLVLAAIVALICLGQPNATGWWTFAVLWTMRLSAKLNLYLGVRNTGAELLPEHLKHFNAYFSRRAINLLFPLSVTAGTVVLALLCVEASRNVGSMAAGLWLTAALLGLALLEHWLMVLPLKSEPLWRIATRPLGSTDPADLPLAARREP